jgi:hypothetical protein
MPPPRMRIWRGWDVILVSNVCNVYIDCRLARSRGEGIVKVKF